MLKNKYKGKRIKYKTINWKEYNQSLKDRGNLQIMVTHDFRRMWGSKKNAKKKKGGQIIYQDNTIRRCIEIRCLFGLKLRQLEGFLSGLLNEFKITSKAPDYTTLSRRCQKIKIKIDRLKSWDKFKKNNEDSLDSKGDNKAKENDEITYICLDSTGIKVYSGKEKLKNKNGIKYERKIWNKLHVSVDQDKFIRSFSVTSHKRDDRKEVGNLMNGISPKEIIADAGYDGNKIYEACDEIGAKCTVRPVQNKGSPKQKTKRYDNAIFLKSHGFSAWAKLIKYHRREQVENTFYRLKKSFGGSFLSREKQNRENEMAIKCNLLNRMFTLCKPICLPDL